MKAYERFLQYIKYETTSDENSTNVPSSACQLELGKYLAKELVEMGIKNAHIDDKGYVYAFIEASNGYENCDAIGLIAHMDTTPDVSGKDVKAKIIAYNGGEIKLNESVSITPEKFECLTDYVGQDLIVTDGTTLLGADDKAGVAEIFTAIEYVLNNPEFKHGKICICITPDEEIGCGADHFDVKKFGAKYAYTVDGGELGEIEYENFNAAGATVTIKGINIHPGAAKNKMKNAALIANKFISLMPDNETPATTEKYEGFYHITDVVANESLATIKMIIRDHDKQKFENKKQFVQKAVDYINSVYGNDTATADIKDSYYNMKEMIIPHMHIIDKAVNAMKACDVEPKIVAIRGGTDGARLSFMGLPCPNLSTGGVNFHSIHEFISIQAMDKMVDVLLEIIKK